VYGPLTWTGIDGERSSLAGLPPISSSNFTGGIAEVGWGTNANILSFALNGVFDPPLALGNIGGSGGSTRRYL
jgi:hypothetical protein